MYLTHIDFDDPVIVVDNDNVTIAITELYYVHTASGVVSFVSTCELKSNHQYFHKNSGYKITH